MAKSAPTLRRQRLLITGALLALAALAWADVVRRSGGAGVFGPSGAAPMGTAMEGMSMAPSSGVGEGALLLGMWTTMMVAMMLPASAPMVYTFAAVHARRKEQGSAYVPTWVFVLGYLLVWAAMGIPAYGASLGFQAVESRVPWLAAHALLMVGAVIFVAGLYQLSPLKYACLSRCQTPLQFILKSWRDGYQGALAMGIGHGWYCVGCCWMLFLILVVVGIMNLAWMGALALLIFAEKLFPRGLLVSRLSGIALLGLGLAVVLSAL